MGGEARKGGGVRRVVIAGLVVDSKGGLRSGRLKGQGMVGGGKTVAKRVVGSLMRESES